LGDKDKNLRVEEITIGKNHAGKKIADIGMNSFQDTLILAIASADKWTYSPKGDHELDSGCRVVVITTPEERTKLVKHFEEG